MHDRKHLDARRGRLAQGHPRVQRRPLAYLVTLALAVALAGGGGCEAGRSNAACDQLQDLSCRCFPLCQAKYGSIIDSQDTQQCNQAVKDAYSYWKRCDGSCTPSCEYGWGSCAFSHYRQVGESPVQACGAGKDAGGDAG